MQKGKNNIISHPHSNHTKKSKKTKTSEKDLEELGKYVFDLKGFLSIKVSESMETILKDILKFVQ